MGYAYAALSYTMEAIGKIRQPATLQTTSGPLLDLRRLALGANHAVGEQLQHSRAR